MREKVFKEVFLLSLLKSSFGLFCLKALLYTLIDVG